MAKMMKPPGGLRGIRDRAATKQMNSYHADRQLRNMLRQGEQVKRLGEAVHGKGNPYHDGKGKFSSASSAIDHPAQAHTGIDKHTVAIAQSNVKHKRVIEKQRAAKTASARNSEAIVEKQTNNALSFVRHMKGLSAGGRTGPFGSRPKTGPFGSTRKKT